MKIQMLVEMSGTRDGKPWPSRGNIIDLPDDEAAVLCSQSVAVPVVAIHDVETADAKTPEVEERVRPIEDKAPEVKERALTTETAAPTVKTRPYKAPGSKA